MLHYYTKCFSKNILARKQPTWRRT